MTNQDNLPVWAKILLGLPVNDGGPTAHSERQQNLSSGKREGGSSEDNGTERNVMFAAAPLHSKRRWQTLLRPAESEFNS
jgi:hypothetical protein